MLPRCFRGRINLAGSIARPLETSTRFASRLLSLSLSLSLQFLSLPSFFLPSTYSPFIFARSSMRRSRIEISRSNEVTDSNYEVADPRREAKDLGRILIILDTGVRAPTMVTKTYN